MKSLFRMLLFFTALVVLAFPVYAQESHVEGIDVVRIAGHNIAATRVDIHATKQIESWGNTSEVHLVANFGGDPLWKVRYAVDTIFTVPLDPDFLEVSGDLGWGGLDVDTTVPVEVTTCEDIVGGNCTTSSSKIPVSIHISGLADQSVTQTNGLYQRRAVFTGTVTIGSRSFDYNLWGYNFADQFSEDGE